MNIVCNKTIFMCYNSVNMNNHKRKIKINKKYKKVQDYEKRRMHVFKTKVDKINETHKNEVTHLVKFHEHVFDMFKHMEVEDKQEDSDVTKTQEINMVDEIINIKEENDKYFN